MKRLLMKPGIFFIAFILSGLFSVNLYAQREIPQKLIIPPPPAEPRPTAIYVPSVFTPNGDGKDDVFKVYSTGLFDMHVGIFTQKKTLIYQWQGTDGSWDGTSGTTLVEQGSYIYEINAKAKGYDHITKIGTIVVLR